MQCEEALIDSKNVCKVFAHLTDLNPKILERGRRQDGFR
jgi:hypothetical protein